MQFYENLFVRADRLALWDELLDVPVSLTEATPMMVRSLERVGDDVEVNGGSFITSIGNVLRVRRQVMPIDMDRWHPSR